MDKNMIHIDDLIKQRLIGEEDERPGAWLHMKDLLDSNMPGKMPAVFNWRRLMTYAGVILAIGAVGVGGYEASTSFRGNNEGIARQSADVHSDEATSGTVVNSAALDNTNDTNNDDANGPVEPAATVAGVSTEKTSHNNSQAAETKNSKKLNKSNKIYSSRTKTEGLNETIAKNSEKANGLVTDKPATQKNDKPTVSRSDKQDKQKTDTRQKQSADKGPNNTASQPGIRKKDSIPMIAVVEKMHFDNNGKPYFTTQQVASGKVAWDRMVAANTSALTAGKEEVNSPVSEPAPASLSHSFIGPMPEEAVYASAAPKANALASRNTNANTGSSNLERKKEKNGWNFRAVIEMLNDAKDRLSNMEVQHSQGVLVGVNALFSTPAFMGFQLGLYENMRFGEHWSMQIEGKYLQRFNGVNLQDNYTTYEKGADGKYTQNLVEHNFKYSSLSSFELPVMVRYNPDKKWNFFAGGSVIYNMAIKNEEISRTNPVATGLTFAQEPENGTPQVHTNDFAARLGLGYLVGVSYNLNSKTQVDARFTQSVWDNAQGAGQQKISNSLYRAPSAQVSFGWRFGKDKKDK